MDVLWDADCLCSNCNSLVRAQMGQTALPPIPKRGKYAEEVSAEIPAPIIASTFNELMGVFGGFSTIAGMLVMSYSSNEIKRRYRIKLIAMKAFMS